MTIIEEFKIIQSFLQKFKGAIIIHDIKKKNFIFNSSLFEKGLLYEVFENKVLLDFPPEKRDKLIVYLEESIKTLFDTKDLDKRLQKIYCRNIRPVSRKGLLNLTSKSGDYVINKWILEKILGYFLSPDLINSYVNKLLPLAGEGKTQKESGKIEGEIKVSSVSEVMSKIEDSSSPGLSRKSAVMVNQSFSDL